MFKVLSVALLCQRYLLYNKIMIFFQFFQYIISNQKCVSHNYQYFRSIYDRGLLFALFLNKPLFILLFQTLEILFNKAHYLSLTRWLLSCLKEIQISILKKLRILLYFRVLKETLNAIEYVIQELRWDPSIPNLMIWQFFTVDNILSYLLYILAVLFSHKNLLSLLLDRYLLSNLCFWIALLLFLLYWGIQWFLRITAFFLLIWLLIPVFLNLEKTGDCITITLIRSFPYLL